MNIVALIPARGGSKSVPRKNIKILNGKPLIKYSIDAAINSKLINRTIVTTDDKEIAEISLSQGAEVPFMRPAKLSTDEVYDFPVIKHAIDYIINKEQYNFDIIVYLRPTLPIRTASEIDQVLKILINNKLADSIRTTRPAIYPPFWMKKINADGFLSPYSPHVEKYVFNRRQDLPQVVMCDGYVDAARIESILQLGEFPPGKILSFYRDNIPFIDIDTYEDWHYCEYYFKQNYK